MKPTAPQFRRILSNAGNPKSALSCLRRFKHVTILKNDDNFQSVRSTRFVPPQKSYPSNPLKQVENNSSEFAKRLRQLMDERDLTQKQVADAAGVTRASVIKWLKNSYPGSAELYRLSKALDVEMQSFFDSIPHKGTADEEIKKMPVPKVPVDAFTLQELHRIERSIKTLESLHKKDLPLKAIQSRIPAVKDLWPKLKREVQAATVKPGLKTRLAEFLNVELHQLSKWLTDGESAREPGAEYALRMQYWVEHPECQK